MVKKNLNNFFNFFENNENFIIYLTSIVILHVCFMDNKIPTFIEILFKNKIFKMVSIILLIMGASNNTMIPIMLTLLFLITLDKSSMNKLNKTKEQFTKNNNNNNNNNIDKTEKDYDISYKNLLSKLENLKENFSQNLVTRDLNKCPNKWERIQDDYKSIRSDIEDVNITGDTTGDVKMQFFNMRCGDTKKEYHPEKILNEINDLEEALKETTNKKMIENTKKNIKNLKFKYNISKQIFKDFMYPENKIIDLQKKIGFKNWYKEIDLNDLEDSN